MSPSLNGLAVQKVFGGRLEQRLGGGVEQVQATAQGYGETKGDEEGDVCWNEDRRCDVLSCSRSTVIIYDPLSDSEVYCLEPGRGTDKSSERSRGARGRSLHGDPFAALKIVDTRK